MTDRPTDGRERPRAVLVAEDEDAVRTFVTMALQQAGLDVTAAPDGRAALDLFAADPHRYDLILTDVTMPHLLGTELAAGARAVRPGVPVLFMSAFPGGAGRTRAALPEGATLLEKPFSVAALAEAVNRALGRP